MLKIFELIGRYFILMGKVFSRPEKRAIYRRRIIYEMESLGLNSIGLTAIISVFIGAVIIAHLLGAGQTLLDLLALLYVFLRVFYVMMYVADMPTARSAVWAGGFLVNIAILFIGYR